VSDAPSSRDRGPDPMGDRERWDRRWEARARGGEPAADREPDPFVVEVLARLGPGAGRRAVDLAAGAGRHTLLLARRGWHASAWDVSPRALEALAEAAARAGLDVERRAVDLTGGLASDEGGVFDLAVVVDFLDRGLLRDLARLVQAGGHALVATFTIDRPGEHPRLAYCLERGELARGLPGFETLESWERGGRAGLLARRAVDPARRA
jgi:SAM-dependent methyltransferase